MSESPKKTRVKSIIQCVINDMTDPFYQYVAPSLAYYFLLSLAPIIIALNYTIEFLINTDILTDLIYKYLPNQLSSMLAPFFDDRTVSFGIIPTLFFTVLTLYLASRGTYALIRVADYAVGDFNAPTFRDVPRRFLQRHLKAMGLTVLMMLIITLSLVFLIFGKALAELCVNTININILTEFAYAVYRNFSYPIVVILIFPILMMFYILMPTKHLTLREAFPGAVTGTVGIFLSSLIFMIYIRYFFDINAIYGALSSIIMIILWFFLLSFVLVLGIMVNNAFRDTSTKK